MKKTYRPIPDYLTIEPSFIDGLGLFAIDYIKENIEIGISHVKREGFEDNYIRTPLGGFVNHSEDPNCKTVEYNDLLKLISIRDIKPGEELTLKYKWYNPNE